MPWQRLLERARRLAAEGERNSTRNLGRAGEYQPRRHVTGKAHYPSPSSGRLLGILALGPSCGEPRGRAPRAGVWTVCPMNKGCGIKPASDSAASALVSSPPGRLVGILALELLEVAGHCPRAGVWSLLSSRMPNTRSVPAPAGAPIVRQMNSGCSYWRRTNRGNTSDRLEDLESLLFITPSPSTR